jgi:hypothetical protein
MADDNLRNVAIATMWVLMAEAREVPNTELQKRYGVHLKKADREALLDLGYISGVSRSGRISLTLADGGWAWCKEHLSAERPEGSGAMGGALYAVLRGIYRFSQAKDYIPSEIFVPVAKPEPVQSDPIEVRVRAAYRKLTDQPGGWVSLTKLRPLLGDLPKKAVDDTLRRMDRSPSVSIVPEENRKALTAADRAAAVRIGSHDNHYIAIEGA